MSSWIEYVAEGDDYVPISRWGKDHWSTFAYLETVAVDAGGQIDNRRMRCNPRLHRQFAHAASFHADTGSGGEYPTRMRGGDTISRHDDWSCLEDMVSAGLLRAWFSTTFGRPFGDGKAKIQLTDEGKSVAAQLRAYKADGGTFSTFVFAVADEKGGPID